MSLSSGELLIGWGEAKHGSMQEIDREKPAFYVTDFFLTKQKPWVQYPCWEVKDIPSFRRLLESADLKEKCQWTIPSKEKFRDYFDALKLLLDSRYLEKGVPYLFANSLQKMDEKRLLLSLHRGLEILENQKSCLYGHWCSSEGVLGITPETLFFQSSHTQQKVSTMALAGTSRSSSQDALMKSEKDQHEHRCVIDGIAQSLQSLGRVEIGNTELLKLPHLTHLMTSIDVELTRPFDFEEWVRALHPTPALGAFPSLEGKEWLQQFNVHTPRHMYGAPIGFQCFQKGEAHCFVGIRNVQWNRTGMKIGAGCGVVKQSVFEQEWEEIQLKLKSTLEQLNL